MSIVYRAVKAKDNNDIIAIGCDENQAGVDYNGIGTWCDFTFEEIPQASKEIIEYAKGTPINILKVNDENNGIVVKSLEEIKSEINNLQIEPEVENTEEESSKEAVEEEIATEE